MTGNLKLCESWMLRGRRAAKFPRSRVLVQYVVGEIFTVAHVPEAGFWTCDLKAVGVIV